jgi:hypothetical protein
MTTQPEYPDVPSDIVHAHINHVARDLRRVTGDAVLIARSKVSRIANPTGKDSLDSFYQGGQVTADLCCQLAREIVPIVASSYYSSQQSHYSRQAVDKEDIEQFLYATVLSRYLANIDKNPTLYLVSSFRKSFYVSCQRECMGHYRMYIRNHGRGTLRTRLVHIDADNGNGSAVQLVSEEGVGSEPTALNIVVKMLLQKHNAPKSVCVWHCPHTASAAIEMGQHVKIVRTIGECGDFVIGEMSSAIRKVLEATGAHVIPLPRNLVENTSTILGLAAGGAGKAAIRKETGLSQADFNAAWECAAALAKTPKETARVRHAVSDSAGLDTYSAFDEERSLAHA